MPKNPDILTDVLNKLWAFRTIKLLTLQEIAKHVGADQRSISDWLTQRRRRPMGDVAFKLQSLAATMTLRVSRRPNLSARYRAAYQTACEMFPTTGAEEK